MFNLFIFCIFFQSSLCSNILAIFSAGLFINGFWEVFISLNLTFMNLLNGSCYMTILHLHKSIWQRSENRARGWQFHTFLGGGGVRSGCSLQKFTMCEKLNDIPYSRYDQRLLSRAFSGHAWSKENFFKFCYWLILFGMRKGRRWW